MSDRGWRHHFPMPEGMEAALSRWRLSNGKHEYSVGVWTDKLIPSGWRWQKLKAVSTSAAKKEAPQVLAAMLRTIAEEYETRAEALLLSSEALVIEAAKFEDQREMRVKFREPGGT